MNIAAITHRPMSEYAYALDETHYVFRLRAQAGDLKACAFWYADRATMGELTYARLPMTKTFSDALFDWFEIRLTTPYNRISYYFEMEDGVQTMYYIGGVFQQTPQALRSDGFQFSFNHRADRLAVPDWTQDAVVYNIFPDSFATGKRTIAASPKTAAWQGMTTNSLLGGTISGICENLDYLQEMGFTCIYLNPIFAAGCYHKYDTLDYFHIDPCFGTDDEFRTLVGEVHARGMRIIIDGVFNHISSAHPFFQDVLAKGKNSPYYDWFYDLPEHPRLPENGEPPVYACFAYVAEMPKTNLDNAAACEYFCQVGAHWITEYDVDGWRLDVANELNDSFLRAFRQTVKAAKKDAIIIGEVWEDGSRYLQGDMLDSCMNYDFRRFAMQFFASRAISAADMAVRLDWLMTRYKEPAMRAQLNLLDSHDVNRFLSECGGDADRMVQAMVLQMTLPGMPSVFYGDECALLGTTEPAYRQAMQWTLSHPIKAMYEKLIRLRKEHAALRRGQYRCLKAEGGFLAYAMQDGDERIAVLLNCGKESIAIEEYTASDEILLQSKTELSTLNSDGFVILKG